jgi:tetratricopeptide (TPR) repeat protein
MKSINNKTLYRFSIYIAIGIAVVLGRPSLHQAIRLTQELSTDLANTYYNRGLAHAELQNYQVAIEDFTRAIQINKISRSNQKVNKVNIDPDAEIYYNRALALLELGDKQAAIRDLTQVIDNSIPSADAYYLRGHARSDLGDQKGAREDYDKATRLYLRERELENINKAIQLSPNQACAYYFRGDVRNSLGDKQGAIADYTKSIQIEPDIADFYYARSSVYSELKNKQGVIADYTQIIRLEPQIIDTYNLRGNLHAELENTQKAIEDYTKAAQVSEELMQRFRRNDHFYPGAYSIQSLGRYCRQYTGIQFAPIASSEQDAQHKLGTVYFNRGIAKGRRNRQEAISDLQKAAKLFSDLEARADYQRVQVALRRLQP